MSQDKYFFDHEEVSERERLRAIELLSDPSTIRAFQEIGVHEKWRCLEVGAGGGSIAEWLCQTVGATGHVVAADLEVKFLKELDYPNLDVWEFNLITDDLPESEFDLIHARGLLIHLPKREEILKKLARAVKPGGWLFVEDPDFLIYGIDPSVSPPMSELAKKVDQAMLQAIDLIGLDTHFGGRLFGLIRSIGFESVQGRGEVSVYLGGAPVSELMKLTVERLRTPILATGLVTETEFEDYLTFYDNPDCAFRILMSGAWGRKPMLGS